MCEKNFSQSFKITVMKKKNYTHKTIRNSNVEILRLLCAFLIVISHMITNAYGDESPVPHSPSYIVFLTSVCSIMVSSFMLISGYYSISFSWRKLIKLECMVVLYSILFYVIGALQTHSLIWNDGYYGVVHALFPIWTGSSWYICCYFVVLLLSNYLNKIKYSLDRVAFKSLILIHIFLFSFLPTIFYWGPVDGGSGKTLFIMITYYLLGQYLAYYNIKIDHKVKYALICIILIFGGNYIATFLLGSGLPHKVFTPFARENSLLTVVLTTLVLLSLVEKPRYCKLLNDISSHSLAVILLDYSIKGIIENNFELFSIPTNLWMRLVIIISESALVLVIAIIIDTVRVFIFTKFENKLADYCEKRFAKFKVL